MQAIFNLFVTKKRNHEFTNPYPDRDVNPQPLAPKSDALATELLRHFNFCR